jgi:hypothetical protein
MIKDLFPNGVTPTCLSGQKGGPKFPEGVPKDKKFALILFAGCNILDWLFHKDTFKYDMELLSNVLDDNGHIIFTDTKKYMEAYIASQNFHARFGGTMYIKNMADFHTINKIKGKNYYKDAVLSTWKTLFAESQINATTPKNAETPIVHYKAYTKIMRSPKKGGTRKNRR